MNFFFFRILTILIHTQGEKGEGFEEIDSDVYPKDEREGEKKNLNFRNSLFEFKMKYVICQTFMTSFLREVVLP